MCHLRKSVPVVICHWSFFNKELSRVIMTRTKLRKLTLQYRMRKRECIIQNKGNFVSLSFKKIKKEIPRKFSSEKSAVDRKLFWKNVKPFLSDKVLGKDEIHLIENNKPYSQEIT